jgi:hypothetical protein
MRLYACRYAKLYVVHMGYLGDARRMPGGCMGDARGNARGILKPHFKKIMLSLSLYVVHMGLLGDARRMPRG